MARNSYQYETSPRKIQPEYNPKKRETKVKKNTNSKKRKEELKQKKIALKQQKVKNYKNIALIISMFLILLAVSYRSSLITEKFNQIQNKKVELSSLEKTNGQLEVEIEESINLGNIEKQAKKGLGMKKMTNDQKVYVNLNNKDYTESTKKDIKNDDNINWFQKFINSILGK